MKSQCFVLLIFLTFPVSVANTHLDQSRAALTERRKKKKNNPVIHCKELTLRTGFVLRGYQISFAAKEEREQVGGRLSSGAGGLFRTQN